MPSLRPAARALIRAPDGAVLLVRFVFGDLQFWGPPGGGVEGEESHADALARELREETGLVDAVPERLLYTHRRRYHGPNAQGWEGQHDKVWLVSVPSRFVPAPELSLQALHAENVGELKWFTPDELEGALTMPRSLVQLIRELPPEPLHLDDWEAPTDDPFAVLE